MNRLIATVLEVTNILTAFGIICSAAFLGAKWLEMSPVVGGIVGGVMGTVFAAGVCGIIAFLALIEKHLSFLAKSVEWQNVVTHARIDPEL